jgi:hypothetical protein
MPNHDRRSRNSGACLAAEKERRASNVLWIRNVRVSLAEIASWQLGPNFVEPSRASRRLLGSH